MKRNLPRQLIISIGSIIIILVAVAFIGGIPLLLHIEREKTKNHFEEEFTTLPIPPGCKLTSKENVSDFFGFYIDAVYRCETTLAVAHTYVIEQAEKNGYKLYTEIVAGAELSEDLRFKNDEFLLVYNFKPDIKKTEKVQILGLESIQELRLKVFTN